MAAIRRVSPTHFSAAVSSIEIHFNVHGTRSDIVPKVFSIRVITGKFFVGSLILESVNSNSKCGRRAVLGGNMQGYLSVMQRYFPSLRILISSTEKIVFFNSAISCSLKFFSAFKYFVLLV